MKYPRLTTTLLANQITVCLSVKSSNGLFRGHPCKNLALVLLGLFGTTAQAFSPNELKPVGYHLGGIDYYSCPYFANGIAIDQRNWRDKSTNQTVPRSSGQFDRSGNPLYLQPGQVLVTLDVGMDGLYRRPSTWPDRDEFYEGKVVLTWQAEADIRVMNASLLSGVGTGSLVNGRREYRIGNNPKGLRVEVHAVNPANPPTMIRAWLPDPADPQNATLEGQIFHPTLLDRIHDAPWSYIRFMDWCNANANPQIDWMDRRLPSDCFMNGVINPRSPAPGAVLWTKSDGKPVYPEGNRNTGAAFEYMVALCNETGKDLWITVPHMASDDFIYKLAQLIAFGSDGENPYTSTRANPVWAPLHSSLKVYLEYSNEIWSNGDSFPQGNWAEMQAQQQGISRARFNARRFSHIWSIFENVLPASRVVRVAAIYTASANYTPEFIGEFYNNPSLLHPELMACTTYFGSSIQNWVNDHINFPRTETPWSDAYWTSPELEADI